MVHIYFANKQTKKVQVSYGRRPKESPTVAFAFRPKFMLLYEVILEKGNKI